MNRPTFPFPEPQPDGPPRWEIADLFERAMRIDAAGETDGTRWAAFAFLSLVSAVQAELTMRAKMPPAFMPHAITDFADATEKVIGTLRILDAILNGEPS